MDRRRVLLTSLAGAVVVPLAAEAQPAAKIYQVGVVSNAGSPKTWRAQYASFIDGMRELHYVEGRNLILRPAFAEGKAERLPALISELVNAKVDVIVTSATVETLTAKRATSSIPIVMWVVPDPVINGLVASLARPGGNITGLTNLVPGLAQKYVELLRETVPSARRFAVVAAAPNPRPDTRQEIEAAGRTLGVAVPIIQLASSGADDFDDILTRAKKDGADGIIAPSDAVTYLHRRRFVELALKHRLPGIYWSRDYVDAGGLMTYGASLNDLRRRAAIYVDKILKGAKPADLPVEQPTKFELVINLATAHALGLTIPPSLLLRADQVIE